MKKRNSKDYDPYYDDIIDEQYELTQADNDELFKIQEANQMRIRIIVDWTKYILNLKIK